MSINNVEIPTKTVRFYTLGCKVNQYETQAMREALERHGYKDIEGQKGIKCDLVVINTCTVTQDADRTNRYWVRRLKREHPEARVAVTGCYVEKNRAEIDALPEVDLIFPNNEKERIFELIENSCGINQPQNAMGNENYPALSVSKSEGKTRAYVKIQDGCNHACSYCKVSIVRGASRSRPLPDILDEIKRLRDSGYKEIILTGIQLGAYGKDFDGKNLSLRDVIEACAQFNEIKRVRLSSIELTDLDEPLRAAFCEVPKLCPHIHLPLQSGDNEILKKMNRRYTREQYRDVVLEMKERVADFEFSVDALVGFPSETDEQFQNTLNLLKELQPLKTHVFPYSPREGTAASGWGECDKKIVRDRVRALSKAGDEFSLSRRNIYLGRTFDILAEYPDEKTGRAVGLTPNFLKVFFECQENVQGCIIPYHLTEIFEDGFKGESLNVLTKRRD